MRPCVLLLVSVFAVSAFAEHSPKRVVIDPGHGGQNMGAIGPYGLYEKYITLLVALRLGELLEQEQDIVVFYTRKHDVFVGIADRAELANSLDADAFVSIHCNAEPSGEASGFETYFYGSPSDNHSERVASVENEKEQIFTTEAALPRILADISRNGVLAESAALAEYIQNAFRRHFPNVPSRDVRQARFAILEQAKVPAVVVEIGFLTHPQEGLNLLLSTYQQQIAKALYEAITTYLRQGKPQAIRIRL